MKKSDLYREYARVIDMCEGTGIDPRLCWKCLGVIQSCSPSLNATPEEYEFALAIVEGKPVFEGDVLYFDGTCVAADIVVHRATADCIVDQKGGCWSIDRLHWTPPKPKTITVTIPRPQRIEIYSSVPHAFDLSFADLEEREIVRKAFDEAMK